METKLNAGFVAEVRRGWDGQGWRVLDGAVSASRLDSLREALGTCELPEKGDLPGLLNRDPRFLDLVDLPSILHPVVALMGGAIHVVTSAVTTVPSGATPMVWHEDGPRPWSYPAVDGKRPLMLLRAGIALEDNLEADEGNLVVVTGSHREPFPEKVDSDALWADPRTEQVRMRAGDVVLFHNGLWHTTAHHRGGSPRRMLYLVYAPLWHRSLDYSAPSPELLASIEGFPEERRPLLKQLVGHTPEAGPIAHMFPEESDTPGLALTRPRRPASGA